ncbi:MAG: hypothetical protein A2249_03530 [Candidatus Jacksonbacteria bacterium RIFOXYA2_FULL_44_7]|uniref:Pseudouridine synthase RsuA/RluA-like domain-containing protein n=1 Tax=Candidatus Jacksonbacteria bacterium RIFCSPLOWO2_02_FULL_44_20 TaxID=1798460 RepID=A0A1G2AAY5_9BACT|nr:MAG: Pseudouridine synthase [Parcubacteria group bacterium GW2011_GWC2_44_17]OGY70200.1 MAG: hypothetical protein A3C00_04220 [Candidatus Jacksonbacteria bacterium RIFCSPHIGHO2_02_FULL_44_25]OGY72144.1 MAG: hypothetical protein A3E05_04480 [Candidatus Jacksonbacteria bacterium RIFCSPHIGHO2_12_FULL_44_12]OGY73197.1 MAG: hypothetical protein A3H61_05400 [Candidatus Jacksonbacteria bacterium RIFCSPLOWO2_02_FULL_44_20]OGY75139.1 MAG: hypothetical protein A2249_03530 [Candidatus Jacksonbacteria b
MEVIFTASDYLIIGKPAGLLVHPTNQRSEEKTLVDFLRVEYPETVSVGDDPRLRPGIVHRLDRDVSGLMLVCRTQKFFNHIKNEFVERRVLKRYTALCNGRIIKDEGDIALPLHKVKMRTLVKPRGDESGKEAHTHFEVLRRFQHYTLLDITLKTGRANQIRAHFYGLEHSIVGDSKYCNTRFRNRASFTRFVKFDRVFLHARYLGFYDFEGMWREYESALPAALAEFLTTLAKSS